MPAKPVSIFRLRTRYVDEQAATLDDALAALRATPARKAVSVALCANAADSGTEV